MTIEELINCVGMQYKYTDSNNKALGCMLPVYLLYPNLPHFDWPNDLGKFMREMFNKYGKKIELRDIEKGDLLLIRLPFGLVHPAVYIGNDEMIDCRLETGLQKSRMSMNSRIEGVFRCQGLMHSGLSYISQ